MSIFNKIDPFDHSNEFKLLEIFYGLNLYFQYPKMDFFIFFVLHINFGDILNFIILPRARAVLIDYIIGSRIERKFMVFLFINGTQLAF